MSSVNKRRNILQLMRDRELNDHIRSKYALKNNINTKCISKLGLFGELKGHQGCVNCLQWNERGSTLASASDDFHVILWDPFLQKVKKSIPTLHRGNIFTVKFLPSCNDDIIVTGAGDSASHTYNVTTGKQLSSCTCAHGRIKRIAVANDTPNVYWSASEDGCIRQYDMRISHECHSNSKSLVSLYNISGIKIEAKCLDINQHRTEQLAVGANDPYVRLYDRRMIQALSSFTVKYPFPKNSSDIVFMFNGKKHIFKNKIKHPDSIVQYFVPGHIHLIDPKLIDQNKNIGITYLTFSPDGQELLVNYGGEYAYLYDVLNQVENAFCNIPKALRVPRGKNGEGSSKDILYSPILTTHSALPNTVEQLKLKANHFFENTEYTSAINYYNEAIGMVESSILFSNRAAAYIKRKWHGDIYAALKDCVTALKLDPNHMKSHFRLAVCLYELGQLEDSIMYLDQFTKKFPSCKYSVAYKVLQEDIVIAKLKKQNDINEFQPPPPCPERDRDINAARQFERSQKMVLEEYLRGQARDYHYRYYGHCNTSTDIKEANFFGNQAQFVVAGSDDGLIFVWDKKNENNLLILKGDTSIVNCLQPHPSEFMLATSGIDHDVKLWTPLSDNIDNKLEVKNYNKTATINQRRMRADPFDLLLQNLRSDDDTDIERSNRIIVGPMQDQFYNCRPS